MARIVKRSRTFLWKILFPSILSCHLLPIASSSFQSPLNLSDSSVYLKIIGPPVSVWSAAETMKHCDNGKIDVPDIPARAFLGSNEDEIRIIVGAVGYHEMHGPNIFNQTRSCDMAWNATFDPDPSMFAGNEFLDSTVRFENGTVVALVHTEFPGNDYNACDTFHDSDREIRVKDANHYTKRQRQRNLGIRSSLRPLSYPMCWTVSIGMAISYDFGRSWDHVAKPPHHLVAAVPYRYNQSHLAYGWGDPSNIVRSTIHCSNETSANTTHRAWENCYYYVAMFNRNQIGDQPPGICMARTKDVLDPSSWRGWNGSDYSVRFASPYMHNDNFDPRDHICETILPPGTPDGCTILGLVWSKYLHEFVATIGCLVGRESGKSFFLSTSKDLIHWRPVTELYNRDQDLPPDVRSMTTSIHYPSLLDPTDGGPNFQTIGQKPYLFWTSIGHSPHTDGRHLWATPIQFGSDADTKDGKGIS